MGSTQVSSVRVAACHEEGCGNTLMAMTVGDTSRDVFEAQVELYRAMTPAKRVQMSWDMTSYALGVAADGIRSRHADYSEEEVQWALRRLRVGDELFRAAWPDAPVLDP